MSLSCSVYPTETPRNDSAGKFSVAICERRKSNEGGRERAKVHDIFEFTADICGRLTFRDSDANVSRTSCWIGWLDGPTAIVDYSPIWESLSNGGGTSAAGCFKL